MSESRLKYILYHAIQVRTPLHLIVGYLTVEGHSVHFLLKLSPEQLHTHFEASQYKSR